MVTLFSLSAVIPGLDSDAFVLWMRPIFWSCKIFIKLKETHDVSQTLLHLLNALSVAHCFVLFCISLFPNPDLCHSASIVGGEETTISRVGLFVTAAFETRAKRVGVCMGHPGARYIIKNCTSEYCLGFCL